jgi:RNA polymerase sigma-70 factor, ECF subfamily
MVANFDDSRGDTLAAQRLEELFVAHRKAVVSYARRRAPAESVDDVVAETFLIAWRRLERVPADSPLPWLLAVARNLIANQRRGAGRRDALSLRLQEMTAEAIDPPSVQETGAVVAAMARLGEKDREALELVAIDGLLPREAATVLGELPGTFRARLHRAKRRLRRLLVEEQSRQPVEPSPRPPESQTAQPYPRPLKAKETRT